MKKITPINPNYFFGSNFLLKYDHSFRCLFYVIIFWLPFNSFGQTYTTIQDGDYDDPNIWSLDNGVSACGCTPPLDKIESGRTVVIKHDVVASSDVTILIEDGGAFFMISGRLDMEQNMDVKPGGYFETSKSYIFSENGNIKNEGTVLHNFSCIILENGNFINVSGLDGDGNDGLAGNGAIRSVNGNIENSGFWEVNVTWCALNGSSDLPPGDEDCSEASAICDTLSRQANMEITKSGPSTISNGTVITYTLIITNNGPDEAAEIEVNDVLPAEITSPEFSTDGGINWLTWTGSFTYSNLANGGSETLLIRGTVSGTGGSSIINTADVSPGSRDIDLSDNTSSVSTQVINGFTIITNRQRTYRVKKN